MVARKLRIESLEARRLFVADLDPIQTNTSDQDAIALELATQITESTSTTAEPVLMATSELLTGDAPMGMMAPMAVGSFDQMGSPFLIETRSHLIAARLNYQTRSTELHILSRQEDGTATESSTLQLEFQVERMFRLGNEIVVFGSKYDTESPPEIRVATPPETVVAVIDPSSGEIKYKTTLSGIVIQAVELPTGIAFETSSIHYAIAETMSGEVVDAETAAPLELPIFTKYPDYQLGYLYSTADAVGINWQSIETMTTLGVFQGSLIAFSQIATPTSETSSVFIAQRWEVSEQTLQPQESVEIPCTLDNWEYIQSFEVSPDGSRLLVSQPSQEIIDDKTYLQKNTLTWLSLGPNGLMIEGSHTLQNFVGSVRWISDEQIVLLSYDVLDQVQILDIRDSANVTLSTLPLSQRLQLNQVVRIDETHVALIGFTAVTPIPVNETGERIPEIVPMIETYPTQGAIVIVDLTNSKVTDERIFEPRTMLDQAFAITELPGHFAWRSFTTREDWSYEEAIHVGTIDEAGKLVITDEAVLGSSWSNSVSNGKSLTVISTNALEERDWSDITQTTWRVEFNPTFTEEIAYPSEPIPGNIDEVLRGEISEEIFTTTLTPPVDLPMDTNGDGAISPIDILQVINYINRAYADADSDELLNVASETLDRYDFDGDSKILPSDALMMIASLNVVHATFEMIDDTGSNPELPEEPCFWDMVTLESDIPTASLEESLNEFFGNLIEIEQTHFEQTEIDPGFWAWFAPLDPWANRLKQELFTLDDPATEELS